MSGSGFNFSTGPTPPVPDVALWKWDTTGPLALPIGFPVSGVGGVSGSTFYSQTKTGLLMSDLQAYVGVPLVYNGNPPSPVSPETAQQWIRYAEDTVEQETSILLCQTWVASPPAQSTIAATAIGIQTNSGKGFQVRGFDYDLEDAAYDFFFQRAQDEGWVYLTTRYRPVQSISYGGVGGLSADIAGNTAIKNTSFIYPLLNQFFRMPTSWNVEDRDYGYIRYVPATNVQMLPLFAMQLAFMGFAESVPGAIWLQYTAGLTAYDYATRWSFMKQLVLAEAAIIGLNVIQGTVNFGAEAVKLTVDGLNYETKYNPKGAYAGLISSITDRRDKLMFMAKTKVAGPMMAVL